MEVRKTFVVRVVYVIPARDELMRLLPGYVNRAYDGITFEPIRVCEWIDRRTREISFEVVHMGRATTKHEVLDEMDRRNLRPAMPEELIAFGVAHPEEVTKHPILALGSETYAPGDYAVACLSVAFGGLYLHLDWVRHGWDDQKRFLAVREAA